MSDRLEALRKLFEETELHYGVSDYTVAELRDGGVELIEMTDRLKEEIAILRSYGNKNCTTMADAELARRRGETE